MDQIVVLVVVGVLALAKWLFENAGNIQSGDTEDTPEPPSRRPVGPRRMNPADPSRQESDEEKMRRFMEALGLPAETPPPPARPPVSRPAAKPAMRPIQKQPERPTERPSIRREPLKPSPPVVFSAPLKPAWESKPLPPPASVQETAPAMEVTSMPQMTFARPEQAVESAAAGVATAARPAARPAASQGATDSAQALLREQLRDPSALRRAILLREILGAPKGLQSGQSPSIFLPL